MLRFANFNAVLTVLFVGLCTSLCAGCASRPLTDDEARARNARIESILLQADGHGRH